MQLSRITMSRPLVKTTGLLLVAITGAILFISLLGETTFKTPEATLKVSLVPFHQGQTKIQLPPFGNISAQTHNIPVEINIRLEQVRPNIIQDKWHSKVTQAGFLNDLKKQLSVFAWWFVIRQILAAAFGASILVFLIFRTGKKATTGAGLTGALLFSAILLLIMANFKIDAFQEPQYDGVVALAPNVIRTAGESLTKLEKIQNQTEALVENIEALFAQSKNIPVLSNPEVEGSIQKILLVSDLHSNPVGINLIRSLSQDFAIDFIIDAGDLTDFGSSMETQMAQEIGNLNVPYFFCPGNHDTPTIISFINKLKNGTVMQGETVTINKITLLGIPDPLSVSPEVDVKDRNVSKELLISQAKAAHTALDNEGQPDILVIHNPWAAEKLAGYQGVIVSGHTHQQSFQLLAEKTILLNPGSTGAAGLRGLYSEKGTPYSAIILHYHPEKGPVAADFIQYEPISARFSLERRLINSLTGESF